MTAPSVDEVTPTQKQTTRMSDICCQECEANFS